MPDQQQLQAELPVDCSTSPAYREFWSNDHLIAIIDRRLRVLVPGAQIPPQRLHHAMGYTLLAPGKRLRPMLALLTSFELGIRDLKALDGACAIEMVHAASLVIDDLPAMDNAEQRRGQSTSHRQFGEDMAILSGIALLNHAFAVVASMRDVPDQTRLEVVRVLSDAVGSNGLIGGQVMDLRERSPSASQAGLERLNGLKTGSLFVAAAEIGALVAGASHAKVTTVRKFAAELGLALQIADDIIDDPTHEGLTGKDTGKDTGKPTLVSLLGNEAAQIKLREHLRAATECLESFGAVGGPLAQYVDGTMRNLLE